jgi:serine/threonine protein kinase
MGGRLEQMNDRTNPYRVGDPVYHDGEHFDRSDEIDEIIRQAKPDGSTAVVIRGPRRIGKSSVLLRAQTLLRRAQHPTAYVDLTEVDTEHPNAGPGELHRAVLAKIVARTMGPDGERVPLEKPELYDTVDGFRSTILPQVASGFPGCRFVVFLDEIEVVAARDETAAAQVLAGLNRGPYVRGVGRPLVVIAEGRTWSESVGESRFLSQLRGASYRDLEVFNSTIISEMLGKPVDGAYSFEVPAIDEVYRQTAGFPLLAAAIGWAIFEGRMSESVAGPVTSKEVLASLPDALTAATGSLVWARGQVPAEQQMLLFALAQIAIRSGQNDKFVTLDEMLEVIERDSHFRFKILPEAAFLQPLIENFIIERGSDQAFRIKAPLFQKWIAQDSFEAIQYRATTKNPKATARFDEGIALAARNEFLPARQAFLDAVTWNPHLWRADLHIAMMDAQTGELDAAVTRVRGIARERPGNLEVERCLGDLLTGKAVEYRARGQQREAAVALREIQGFDSALRRFPKALHLLLTTKVDQWQDVLRGTDPTEWRGATEALAAETAGSAWWWHALAIYCGCLRQARPEDASLTFALGLVREVFPFLLKTVPDTSDSEHAVITDEARAALSAEAAGEVNLTIAWNLTLALLRGALSRSWDPPSQRAPARLLEQLVYLPITEEHRSELFRLADTYLPQRLAASIDQDPDDAIPLIRMLARSIQELPTIRSSLESAALASGENPAMAERFLRLAPQIYSILIDADRQLSHLERIRHIAVYIQQLKFVLDSALASRRGDAFLLSDGERDEWRRLLSHFAIANVDGLKELEEWFGHPDRTGEINLQEQAVSPRPAIPDRDAIQTLLGHDYYIGEPLPREIPGVPSGAVRQYIAVRQHSTTIDKEERVLVRAYSTKGYSDGTRDLLHWLWNNEYRALYSLSTRWEGRALPRLIFAHVDSKNEQYVLVSELIGPRSLRNELDEGRMVTFVESDRGDLWRELHSLTEAVAGLHRLGYIHRAIKPENILLTPHGIRSRTRFRLANFEWSVYLHSLAKFLPVNQRNLDYYLPPEVLALEFDKPTNGNTYGEGFGVDAYAMGLIFFECMVRRLRPDERRVFVDPNSYDVQRHFEWLERLRTDAENAVRNENLRPDEESLIARLLEPDPRRREADLDRISDETRRLAVLRSGLARRLQARPLMMFTPLNFDDPSCVKNFLENEVALPDDAQSDPKALARFIEDELRDAYVFLSSSADEKPLLLKGKRVAFTAQPFRYDGQEYRRAAFLEVAKRGITADGDWLTRIGAVTVKPITSDLRISDILSDGAWWEELFTLADEKLDDLGINQLRFLRKLSITLGLESRVWERSIYRCEIVDTGYLPLSSEQFVVVREATDSRSLPLRRTLREAVEDNVDRQINEFDLSRSSDATAAFRRETQWIFGGIEAKDLIRLVRPVRRLTPQPPPKGEYRFLRPSSLASSRVLYQRHQEVLRQLRSDSYMLRAITSPEEVSHTLSPDRIEVFDKRLDANKEALVGRIRRSRPLFLVQGPPGTGKTTLAREVVLQLLAEEPGARILVTSQGHEPLNNLLDKTEEAIAEELRRREPRLRRPLSIRLLAAEKQFGETATRIDRKYFPSEVASDILDAAASWRPTSEEISSPEIVQKWQQFVSDQKKLGLSATLEERLIKGANIVYATANDRHLANFRDDAFDLVIVEEAARAYPIELLGPIRLARRWLLIGDQKQLPPFGVDDFRAELKKLIEEIEADEGLVGGRREMIGLPRYLGYANAEELHQELDDTTALFQTLYRLGELVRNPISAQLQVQWRMHPTIGRMVSQIFYDDRLKTAEPEKLAQTRRHRLLAPKEVQGKSLIWLDVPSAEADELAHDEPAPGGGFQNSYEIRALQGFLRELKGNGLETAILSPYRGQVRLMQQKFFDTWHHPVTGSLGERVFTVDSFQGRQSAVVAVSLVRNNMALRAPSAIGFVRDRPRATVMFSRAERLLIVVGCSKHFARFDDQRRPSYVTDIFHFINQHGQVLRASDYLRREDIEAMEEYRARRKR